MDTSKHVIDRLGSLDDKGINELYAKLYPRATSMNPLKEWSLKMNPTREDLAELVKVLPPQDCTDMLDLYLGRT